MFKNVSVPITEHVVMYSRAGKMPGGVADIAGITARTQKLVDHTRTEPNDGMDLLHQTCSSNMLSKHVIQYSRMTEAYRNYFTSKLM